MIKLEKTQVVGWEPTIRGMRNPMNSWEKSDTRFYDAGEGAWNLNELDGEVPADSIALGDNDHDLMIRLASAGSVDAKFRRMIVVYVDITAPFYWWKEFDTYKVGTVANSCSTMHKIHAKEFTEEDFSHEHLTNAGIKHLKTTVELLNEYRNWYLKYDSMQAKDKVHFEEIIKTKKDLWWQMIQLLPSSYNQKRTVMLNYEVLAGLYPKRKNHKLDEWHDFCDWIKSLPHSEIITLEGIKNEP